MLTTCASCEGFLPPSSSSACPHCGAARPLAARGAAFAGLATLAAGGAMAITLMACYGQPPCSDNSKDADGDGFCLSNDCNESDPKINASAEDPFGDGIDQNCDGVDGNSWEHPDAGDAGDAATCLSCAQGYGTLGTTQSELCEGAALTSFQALFDCACNTACASVCQDNWCAAGANSPDCQTCIDMQCSTQKLDCQEN